MDADKSITASFTMLPPVASYSAFPTTGATSLTVNFTDTSMLAQSWAWDFGDSTTSNLQNPSHTYSTPGTYSVSLQATNSSGSNIITKNNLVTVTVTPVNSVQIPSATTVSYSTLQAAIDAVQDGEVIQAQAVGFTEDMNFTAPFNVLLNGGFNGDFSASTEMTVVTGTLTITDGSLTVDKLVIQ